MSWRDLVREELKTMEPYRAHASDARVRLDANESPLELPAEVRADLGRVCAEAQLNRYPDILAGELRAHLCAELGVRADQILFGNGSDEIIGLLCATFARPRKNQRKAAVCYPVPSFVIYRTAAIAAGSMPLEVPLRADFVLDEVALERAMVAGQPNLVFLALPNNPTGTLWPREAVENLCKAHPGVLVVADEAYFMYSGVTHLDLLPRYENLLVMRTLSKIGLAGLRVGYLLGHADVIHEVEKVRPPYNVGSLGQRVAVAALARHGGVLQRGVEEVIAERERVSAALGQTGAVVFPSRANFIMVRIGGATSVFQALKARGVLVKCFDRPKTALEGCLRITIGTREENDALLAAWNEIAPRAVPPEPDGDAAAAAEPPSPPEG
jgi:histidinol-phosphate aminotransferase